MTEHTLLCDAVPLADLEQAFGVAFETDSRGRTGILVGGDDGQTVVQVVIMDRNIWDDEDEGDEQVRSFSRSILLTGNHAVNVARRCFDVVARSSRAMLFRDFGTLIAEAAAPVAAE